MIDLRSDTLTKPTKAMYDAMLNAELGDEGRLTADGRGGDPTIRLLEDKAAEITGMEAALFCLSGTMGNLLALMSYTDYGDYCLTNENSHIYRSEKGIFTDRPGGIKPLFYSTDLLGVPDIPSIDKLLKKNTVKAVCIENTNNYYGGTCLTSDCIAEISKTAAEYNVPLHLDGARIFNASLYLNTAVREFARHVDSLMFCISKGLGAPVGSLLCGKRDFIEKARNLKKNIGGVVRQGGIVAAAGIAALETEIPKLKKDHENTAYLADSLSAFTPLEINKRSVQTNILKAEISKTGMNSKHFAELLAGKGLLVNAVDDTSIRLVIYKEINRKQIDKAVQIIKEIIKQ